MTSPAVFSVPVLTSPYFQCRSLLLWGTRFVRLLNDEDKGGFETGPILWFKPRILILHFLLCCFLSIRSVDVGHLKIRLLSRAQGLVPVVQDGCEADWRRRSCWGSNWTKETKAWSFFCHLQLLVHLRPLVLCYDGPWRWTAFIMIIYHPEGLPAGELSDSSLCLQQEQQSGLHRLLPLPPVFCCRTSVLFINIWRL